MTGAVSCRPEMGDSYFCTEEWVAGTGKLPPLVTVLPIWYQDTVMPAAAQQDRRGLAGIWVFRQVVNFPQVQAGLLIAPQRFS